VDFDVLVEKHELLGMSRAQLLEALPALRGMAKSPSFSSRSTGHTAEQRLER